VLPGSLLCVAAASGMVMYRVSDCGTLDASTVERRHSTRYEIHAAVAFFWNDAEAKEVQGEGLTRDISDVGLYIVSEQCPPMKSKVQIEVLFGKANGPGVSLTGNMQVVRIERNLKIAGVFGFAIAGQPLLESNAAQA
jgi:c-di-GMP-binding flagellar brake protein YcgR